MMPNRIHLESPRGDSIENPVMAIQGWCATATSNMTVETRVNGVRIPVVTIMNRPDVEEAYPNAKCFGFSSHIDIRTLGLPADSDKLVVTVEHPSCDAESREFRISGDALLNGVASAPLEGRRRRRLFLVHHLDMESPAILEIGALDSPTYAPEEANVKFLDRFTIEENYEFIKDLPDRMTERLVNVDYAIKSKFFAETIDARFDLVIANHVIEHIPDIIRWINELKKLLKPGGKVFLGIPDRRYTFDYIRPETDVVEILRCYDEDLGEPNFYQMLRSVYMYRPIVAADVWTETLGAKPTARRFNLRDAMKLTKEKLGTGESTHCSVFSRDSFVQLWSELLESGLIDLEITHIADVSPDANDFHVLLGACRTTQS